MQDELNVASVMLKSVFLGLHVSVRVKTIYLEHFALRVECIKHLHLNLLEVTFAHLIIKHTGAYRLKRIILKFKL
jgi:hypothetical protein